MNCGTFRESLGAKLTKLPVNMLLRRNQRARKCRVLIEEEGASPVFEKSNMKL